MQPLFQSSTNESNWEHNRRLQAEASPAERFDALLSAENILLEIERKWRGEPDKEIRMGFQTLYRQTKHSLAQTQGLLPFCEAPQVQLAA